MKLDKYDWQDRGDMLRDDNGEYYHVEDVDPLLAELETLRAERDQWMKQEPVAYTDPPFNWEKQIYDEITTAYRKAMCSGLSYDRAVRGGTEVAPEAVPMPTLTYLFIDKGREKTIYSNCTWRSEYGPSQVPGGLFFHWERHKLEVLVVNKPDFLMVI